MRTCTSAHIHTHMYMCVCTSAKAHVHIRRIQPNKVQQGMKRDFSQWSENTVLRSPGVTAHAVLYANPSRDLTPVDDKNDPTVSQRISCSILKHPTNNFTQTMQDFL